MKQKVHLKEDILDLQKISNSVPKYVKFPKLAKKLFKRLTKVWSEDTEEAKRVMSFLTILKALRLENTYYELVIKLMFSAFVRNSKFVTGLSMSQINFMRCSLLEVFGFNTSESYAHAFVFIRQLAIMLRKAYDTKAKEDTQAVFCWQFVNSLQFWSEYVARYLHESELVSTLRYPLIQLIISTIRLNPGERWLPLRFHCSNMLTLLAGGSTCFDQELKHSSTSENITAKNTKIKPRDESDSKCLSKAKAASMVYIPSLNIILDVFRLLNLRKSGEQNKKKKSNKITGQVLGGGAGLSSSVDLRLFLHFSPSQQRETGTRDACVSWLVDSLSRCLAVVASSVSFPELAAPAIAELRASLKTCRVPGFTRRLRTLLVRIREQVDYVKSIRQKRHANPICLVASENNQNSVSEIEKNMSNDPKAPFTLYYTEFRRERSEELARLAHINKQSLTEDNNKPLVSDGEKVSKSSKETTEDIGAENDSDEDNASVSSDGSYDLDDGKTTIHVPANTGLKRNAVLSDESDDSEENTKKSKKVKFLDKPNQKKRKMNDSDLEEDDDDDDEFDLEKALKSCDPADDEPDAIDINDEDEITDFEIGESSSEEEEEEKNKYEKSKSKASKGKGKKSKPRPVAKRQKVYKDSDISSESETFDE